MSPRAQAVVVGATGEVGAAIVARLRQAEVPVVGVARDRDRLAQFSEGDEGITACPADIGDDSSGEAIAAAVSGPVRMVVQSAAEPPAGPLATIEPDALGRSVSLKLGGLLRLVRAVDDRFAEGSRIVAIGGVFGSEPTPQTCGAGVTNAALGQPHSSDCRRLRAARSDCAHDRSRRPGHRPPSPVRRRARQGARRQRRDRPR
jgi:short-subunit dehydrogenase